MATGRVPTTANSPLTAKGDLFTYSTAPARLAVGNSGEQIVADSSTSTGLRYQGSTAAGRNFFINGAMDIWQRGTSFTPTSASINYFADRWSGALSTGTSGITFSRATDVPTGYQYSFKSQRTAASTATPSVYIFQNIESVNSIPLAGQTVTISVWVKKGANYSGGAFGFNLYTGTGTDQGGYPSSYTGAAQAVALSITPTTTWTRYQATGTIASTTTEIGLFASYQPSGTAGADDSLYFTGAQIEVGSIATNFTRAGGTIQGELAACQRYYYRITGTNAFSNICPAFTDATNNAVTTLTFPVEMRVAPTSVDYSNIRVTNFSGAAAVTSASVSSAFNGKNNTGINLGVAGNPFTAFAPFVISCNNTAAGYLGMSAEL